MKRKTVFLAATLLLLGTGASPQFISGARASECEAGEKIDGSTADSARKKIEGAGFRHVRDLKKGCDNFWHGTAVKDGSEVRVVLSPQGEVMRDGD